MIFHTKYPKKFRASLRSAHFLRALPNLKYWIRPCKLYIILRDCTLLWQTVHYSERLYIIMTNCTLFWKTVSYSDKLCIIRYEVTLLLWMVLAFLKLLSIHTPKLFERQVQWACLIDHVTMNRNSSSGVVCINLSFAEGLSRMNEISIDSLP